MKAAAFNWAWPQSEVKAAAFNWAWPYSELKAAAFHWAWLQSELTAAAFSWAWPQSELKAAAFSSAVLQGRAGENGRFSKGMRGRTGICLFFPLAFGAPGDRGLIGGVLLRWASSHESCFPVAFKKDFSTIQMVFLSPSFARFPCGSLLSFCVFFLCLPFWLSARVGGRQGLIRGVLLRWVSPHESCFPFAFGKGF